MVYALILSGGKGVRLGKECPKQYLIIGNKPIIGYSLDAFQNCSSVDGIVIVADDSWHECIKSYICENSIGKFAFFAPAGKSRTHSILNGLLAMREHGVDDSAIVIIHDAARPKISDTIIFNCISELEFSDCAMPIIPVKDTIYMSKDGKTISSLLNRDYLCAGQAPESVRLGQFLRVLNSLPDEELSSLSGTSAIAHMNGLTVSMFPGSEDNYKITTMADLDKFRMEIEE